VAGAIRHLLRGSGFAALGLAALSVAAVPVVSAQAPEIASAAAEVTTTFDIPAGTLAEAIERFGEQSGLRVLYQPALAENVQAPAVSGPMRAQEALRRLLEGTGLVGVTVNDKTLVIRRAADIALEGADAGTLATDGTLVPPPADVDPGVNTTGAPTTASVTTSTQGGIEEIIVTGQKKEERLQDVPIAISAFSAEQLDAQKIEGGFDLLKAVPNVTFSKSNYSSYNFSIRGVLRRR
jgi:hypothetical protein